MSGDRKFRSAHRARDSLDRIQPRLPVVGKAQGSSEQRRPDRRTIAVHRNVRLRQDEGCSTSQIVRGDLQKGGAAKGEPLREARGCAHRGEGVGRIAGRHMDPVQEQLAVKGECIIHARFF